MAITAADIENQSFSISKKGYDVDEVDVFLEHVANEIDALNKLVVSLRSGKDSDSDAIEAAEDNASESGNLPSSEQLSEKDKLISELKARLEDKDANDAAISQALIVAQRSADEIIAGANAKAEATISDAHEEADRIVSRAEAEKDSIMEAISKLEEDKEGTRIGFADMLKDFIEDANEKLSSLGFDDDVDAIPYDDNNGADDDIDIDELSGSSIQSGNHVQPAHVVEKDFSGFGAVADDFDDVD